ncbi:MAG: PAS domain-containing sensor histidine kinase [Desulfarculus sp.]|nr:PAS domain-containing sensor histidine kinase [Desulfarculus sp.]
MGKAATPKAECGDGQLLAELRASEERYRSVTQTAVDAIITTDQEGTVLTWNQGAEVMFGFGPEMVGRSVLAIIPQRYRQAHEEGVRRYLATGQRRLIGQVAELAGLRQDGGEFPIELSLSVWQIAQGVCFGAIIRDISERKRVERLREDVQRMIRHDLKSPLVGVVGLANLLLKADNLDPRQIKAAATIRDLGQRLLGFIQRSRDIFQLEEGRYQLKPQPVDLLALLGRVAGELEPLARSRGLRLTRRVKGRAVRARQRYLVAGEEGLLEVLFENLLKNALEAAPPGSRVGVDLAPTPQGGHLIGIHNLGVIPPEVRDRFFEAYVTSGKQGGTGLGTHSARLIARAHGGDLTFTTSETEGTRLWLSLPATDSR